MFDESELILLKRLVDRLERLSADSSYAHQASGLRGSLWRFIDRMEAGTQVNTDELNQLLEQGFMILGDAAREVGGSR